MYRKKLFSLLNSRVVRSFSVDKSALNVSEEIRESLSERRPVVALESTIITHGMPFPRNVECALQVEKVVRAQGAIPATMALLNGVIKVGLSKKEIEILGDTKFSKPVKVSRRDFPYILSKNLNGGTTVSGTLIVCKKVGIPIFATGGIGGVHRGANETFDVSADLTELGRSNIAVVSSGVKSILDIPKTLEYLETQGVFVATLGGNTEFPAFYCRTSGYKAPYFVSSPLEAAKLIKSQQDWDLQSGLLFAVPVPEKYALDPESMEKIIREALAKADKAGVKGKEVTPYLLSEIARISSGTALETNVALVENNAKVAAEISVHLSRIHIHRAEYFKQGNDSRRRPVIIGGSNLDCVAHLDVDKVKLDGRIHAGRFDYSAGGVGRNICEALGKLGCRSHFLSAIGDDQQGRILMKQLPLESTRYVTKSIGCNTAQCTVVLDRKGDCSFLMGDMNIHNQISKNVIEEREGLIKNAPLLIVDGNLSREAMETALRIAAKYNIPVFYEPTDITISTIPFTTKYWKSIKLITPNFDELQHIATYMNIQSKSTNSKLDNAAEIAHKMASHIDTIIVTLGPLGILLARKGHATEPFLHHSSSGEISVRHYPVQERSDFVNVSGAGDCFASGLIAGYLSNLSESRCISIGLAAAITALYSKSPVPEEIFDKQHESWRNEAHFQTIR